MRNPVNQRRLVGYETMLLWVFVVASLHGPGAERTVRAADYFPYDAYTLPETALVRSGPGTEFYITSDLDWGAKIEVHRRDGDWAAIRPPSNSFSWVPVESVTESDETGLGIVAVDGTRTRIGSRAGDHHEVEYISLNAGDVVEILGRARLSGDDGDDGEWYKISPPAGEFRWVRFDAISRTPPERSVASDHSAAELPRRWGQRAQSEQDGSDRPEKRLARLLELVDHEFELEAPDEDAVSGIPSSGEPTPADDADAAPVMKIRASDQDAGDHAVATRPTTTSGDSPGPAEDSLGTDDSQRTPSSEVPDLLPQPTAVRPPPAAGPAANAWPPDEVRMPAVSSELGQVGVAPVSPLPLNADVRLEEEILQLEWELTKQAAQQVARWNLSDLRARTEAVIDASSDAGVRERALRLLAKIAQFDNLQRRQRYLMADNPRPPGSYLALPAPPPPAGNDGAFAAVPSYDGQGWLMPVVTQRAGTPRYALTDDEGNVLQFVTAKPGLNLHEFERKRIGIYGQRGYLPSLDQSHLMAERVIALDKVRR